MVSDTAYKNTVCTALQYFEDISSNLIGSALRLLVRDFYERLLRLQYYPSNLSTNNYQCSGLSRQTQHTSHTADIDLVNSL